MTTGLSPACATVAGLTPSGLLCPLLCAGHCHCAGHYLLGRVGCTVPGITAARGWVGGGRKGEGRRRLAFGIRLECCSLRAQGRPEFRAYPGRVKHILVSPPSPSLTLVWLPTTGTSVTNFPNLASYPAPHLFLQCMQPLYRPPPPRFAAWVSCWPAPPEWLALQRALAGEDLGFISYMYNISRELGFNAWIFKTHCICMSNQECRSAMLRGYSSMKPPPPHEQVHAGYRTASLSLIPSSHTLHICCTPQLGHAVGLRHRASRDGGQGSCCEDGQEVRMRMRVCLSAWLALCKPLRLNELRAAHASAYYFPGIINSNVPAS